MLRSPEVMLTGSVGENGKNHYYDVLAIQQLIDDHLPSGLRELPENGVCDGVMIGTIAELQRRYHTVATPDGRIDPHGPTLRALNRAGRVLHQPAPPPSDSKPSTLSRPSPLTQAAPLPGYATPTPSVHDPLPGFPKAVPTAQTIHASATHKATHHGAHGHAHTLPPEIIAAAQRSHARWNIPASVSLAQWAWESTWGRNMPAGSNNPFGIKARAGEKFVWAWTHETTNHVSERVRRKFRIFNNIDEAFDHHGRMLATFRPYRPALPLRNDPMAYVGALTHVYATDDSYGQRLQTLMRENNFLQYDRQ